VSESVPTSHAQSALNWLHRIEEWLLAILVLVLVALAGAQIVLRNFFDTGLSWADPFLRVLVVWAAMLGALAATREDKHIAIDVVQRFLAPKAQRAARVVTFGCTALICAAMAWYSSGLVGIDYADAASGVAKTIAGAPVWLLECILPFGFGMMAIRFAIRAFVLPAHPPVLLHDPGEPVA
jgi:TRAP-type C4-dicarboxylate transport system permease small subunit